jgi:hypothetical protein
MISKSPGKGEDLVNIYLALGGTSETPYFGTVVTPRDRMGLLHISS